MKYTYLFKIIVIITGVFGYVHNELVAANASMEFEEITVSHDTSSPVVHPIPSTDNIVKIIHPCTQYGFQRSMKNPSILKGFLNTVLGLYDQDDKIIDIDYIEKQFIRRDELGRYSSLKFVCRRQDSEQIFVSLQIDLTEDHGQKVFLNLCHLISYWNFQMMHEKSVAKSDAADHRRYNLDSIRKGFSIVITHHHQKEFNEIISKNSHNNQKFIHIYTQNQLKQDLPFNSEILDIQVILLNLQQFQKTETELKTDLDRWCFAFKETLLETSFYIPTYKYLHHHLLDYLIADTDGLSQFYNVLNVDHLTEHERIHYEIDLSKLNNSLHQFKHMNTM